MLQHSSDKSFCPNTQHYGIRKRPRADVQVMWDLTIGLLGKSCLLRESCLGWEGRLLEAATEAGGKTVGSGSPKARGHAHGRSAKGRR